MTKAILIALGPAGRKLYQYDDLGTAVFVAESLRSTAIALPIFATLIGPDGESAIYCAPYLGPWRRLKPFKRS